MPTAVRRLSSATGGNPRSLRSRFSSTTIVAFMEAVVVVVVPAHDVAAEARPAPAGMKRSRTAVIAEKASALRRAETEGNGIPFRRGMRPPAGAHGAAPVR